MAFVLASCGSGGSDSSSTSSGSKAATTVPAGAIAIVSKAPNGTVTKSEYEAALGQTAPRLGLPKVPPASSPQFKTVKDAAISDLLAGRWIEGEAQERNLDVSQSEVQAQLDQVVKTQFGDSQKKFDAFLKRAHFTQADALERVRLQALTQRIQDQVLPPGASSASAKAKVERFQTSFGRTWRGRTLCASGYVTDRCSNGPPLATPQSGVSP